MRNPFGPSSQSPSPIRDHTRERIKIEPVTRSDLEPLTVILAEHFGVQNEILVQILAELRAIRSTKS